jgi:hypothetical protein
MSTSGQVANIAQLLPMRTATAKYSNQTTLRADLVARMLLYMPNIFC